MTPYAYRAGNTPLHRAGAALKLAALCACSLAAFFAGLPGLALSSVVVCASAFAAGIPIAALFSGSSALAVTTAFVVALRALRFDGTEGFLPQLDRQGLIDGLSFAWGVFASFAAGSVLFATTTTTELRFALARGEAKIKGALRAVLPLRIAAKIDALDLSLTVALALAFIPRVFAVWEAAEDAHRSRCGAKGIAGTAKIVPLVAERLIEAAAETASAMVSRGYAGGSTSTKFDR